MDSIEGGERKIAWYCVRDAEMHHDYSSEAMQLEICQVGDHDDGCFMYFDHYVK